MKKKMNCAVLVVALVVRAPFSTILLVLLKLFFLLCFIICCFQQLRVGFSENFY